MIRILAHYTSPRRLAAFAFAVLFAAVPALADPPARALRLSYVAGDASFAPAGSDAWVVARLNRPLWIGDRLWSGNGQVELQLGGASLRLAPRTSVTVLDFDDRLAQLQVTQGTVAVHVRAIDDRNDAIELATPSLAFVARTEGDYRVDVDPDRTSVSVRRGTGEVWGAGRAFRVERREQIVFYDQGLTNYDVVALPPPDAFDRWARDRARREDTSVSARYVAPELVGFVDLDAYGEWRTERDYGAVWYPRVGAGWAPYRYGQWSWVDPWGWTWVDDAPWGYAPSHYGRWSYVGSRWGWIPGPRDVRPVYAPALVAWVGGSNFSLSVASGPTAGVAWFPLGPGEIWRPGYDVSREYFTRVNVSNTYVQQTTVVNVYNDYRSGTAMRADYRYRNAPAAVTAVPVATFVESQPVQRNLVRVNAQAFASVPIAAAPAARPVTQSFIGSAPRAQSRPPAESLNRAVVAREAPPAVPSLQERVNLARDRGRPNDRQTLEQARPSSPSTAAGAPAAPGRAPSEQAGTRNEVRPNVRVVGTPIAQPSSLPAGSAGTAPRPESRGASTARPAAPTLAPATSASPDRPRPTPPETRTPAGAAAPAASPPPAADRSRGGGNDVRPRESEGDRPKGPPETRPAPPAGPQAVDPRERGGPPQAKPTPPSTPPAVQPERGGPAHAKPTPPPTPPAVQPERGGPPQAKPAPPSQGPGAPAAPPNGRNAEPPAKAKGAADDAERERGKGPRPREEDEEKK